jgi:hypothetical protein
MTDDTTKKTVLGCSDMWKGLGFSDSRSCCSSCHEEFSQGFSLFLEREHPNDPNITAGCCCQVLTTLDKLTGNEILAVWEKALDNKKKEDGENP